MKQILLLIVSLFFLPCFASQTIEYTSLDKEHPIAFFGKCIVYNEDTIVLGPHAFFVDGGLSDGQCAGFEFVYNSISDAVKDLTPGTPTNPMVLYIAPYVYWIDDPANPEVVFPEKGQTTPYGLEIKCNWLKFKGLNPDAKNVVLACNRGQTIGAVGNFTMFKIEGDGIYSENITFGNYCNIDLDYELLPALNRKKRADAIVQAQLIHCNGDKIYARNTRFVSRLNLCPFVGGQRTLFDSCYFECTDDALAGTAVYLNSTLKFFSSKPFYHTTGTGAVFINCDIFSYTSGSQFFTKANGQVAVIDTRMYAQNLKYIGWNDVPPPTSKNYQYNFTLNDAPYRIGNTDATSTVDIKDENLLFAYRYDLNGSVFYNVYNLLKGDDNWDPLNQKTIVEEAENKLNLTLTDIPVKLVLKANSSKIETNNTKSQIDASFFRFGNFESAPEKLSWELTDRGKDFVNLIPYNDGRNCTVIPKNYGDKLQKVLITARSKSGLEGTIVMEVYPEILEAPDFKLAPALIMDSGKLKLDYVLDTDYKDDSEINWYRSNDTVKPVAVAVTRDFAPLKEYKLSHEDVGYYIIAEIIPRHIRSYSGDTTYCKYYSKIGFKEGVNESDSIRENFKNVSTQNAKRVDLPGVWIMQHFNDSIKKLRKGEDAWYYGTGRDGAYGKAGLIPTGRQASLYYFPSGKKETDMEVDIKISPFKTAGQAFSVAGLYADFLVRYDAKTKTGYGIRFIRTTKYHNATDCFFIEYKNGIVIGISDTLSTSCYRPDVTIHLQAKGDILTAHVWSDKQVNHDDIHVLPEINLQANIEPSSCNGFGIEFNGGAASLIEEIKLKWY